MVSSDPERGVQKTLLHRKTAPRCERMETQSLLDSAFSGMTLPASGKGWHLQADSHPFPIPLPHPILSGSFLSSSSWERGLK